MVIKTLINFFCAKRIPLIKFRKGGLAAVTSPGSATNASKTSGSKGSGQEETYHPSAIEDYDLPLRYRRKPIDQLECDYINRGGPD